MAGLYDRARLEVSADVDGDGNDEDGVFEMRGDLNISLGTRTGYLYEGGGQSSNVTAALISAIEGATDGQISGDGKRKKISIDVGGGVHYCEIDFTGWQGSTDQWGDGSATGPGSPTAADATGANPLIQMSILDRYLQIARIDSTNPATLEVAEYSENGFYGPLDVLVEEPGFTFNAEQQVSIHEGSIVFLEAADIRELTHALEREGRA